MKKAIAVLATLLLAGCFEVEQSIDLKKDLSGTADFHLGVDLEPMIVVMAQFGREMEGKKGPITAEELAKAKAEFKKSAKKESKKDEPSRADLEKSLPEGVKLLSYGMKEREFGMDTNFKFGFDKLSQLVGVKLPSKGEGDPTKKNVIDSPFEGLELSEKGDTLTIRTKPQNPTEAVKEQAADAPKLDAATEKMEKSKKLDDIGVRVTYRK
jgi:hypothetical protein